VKLLGISGTADVGFLAKALGNFPLQLPPTF
jgi:hypothetical protein